MSQLTRSRCLLCAIVIRVISGVISMPAYSNKAAGAVGLRCITPKNDISSTGESFKGFSYDQEPWPCFTEGGDNNCRQVPMLRGAKEYCLKKCCTETADKKTEKTGGSGKGNSSGGGGIIGGSIGGVVIIAVVFAGIVMHYKKKGSSKNNSQNTPPEEIDNQLINPIQESVNDGEIEEHRLYVGVEETRLSENGSANKNGKN